MHVLIVEDKRSLAKMLKTSQEEKGHTVVLAFDDNEGRTHAETDLFDMMVLDIMLPGTMASKCFGAYARVNISCPCWR